MSYFTASSGECWQKIRRGWSACLFWNNHCTLVPNNPSTNLSFTLAGLFISHTLIKEGSCSRTCHTQCLWLLTTLRCPWRQSCKALLLPPGGRWKALLHNEEPFLRHDTALSRFYSEWQVSWCHFNVRLTNQTWGEQERSLLGLSGSVASMDGWGTPGWLRAHSPWDLINNSRQQSKRDTERARESFKRNGLASLFLSQAACREPVCRCAVRQMEGLALARAQHRTGGWRENMHPHLTEGQT